MIVLGINGGVRIGYQDVSAVLIIDGEVVAAVEEERINRIKHSAGRLSDESVRWVLQDAGIQIQDVDYVACHGSTWGDDFERVLKGYLQYNFGHCPKVVRVHHHDAHCASAYYASGYDEAMVLSIDNSGDGVSTQLSIGKGRELKLKERTSRPDSLGLFYSLITQYCGFNRDADEYKLMGLASFGDRLKHNLDWLLEVSDGHFKFNTDYIPEMLPGQGQPTRQEMMFNARIIEKWGPIRRTGDPMTQHHKDIAASAQQKLEEALIDLVTRFHKETGLRKLCLAGGVALNCVANQKLMNLDFIDEIYVQPASSDAGISLGAAYLVSVQAGDDPKPMTHVFLGPGYDNTEIEKAIEVTQVIAKRIDDPAAFAAAQVANNKVVGWVQGRMEFGPRALGSRSILANPRHPGMRDQVNKKIKFRETFRPFCPSVLEENSSEYFEGKQKIAPYMTITYDVKKEKQEAIPSVTHVDGTARIQTVNASQNELYYQYLKELEKHNGIGMTMNTSFNLNKQPIVNTPLQAIATFFGCGMDCLVIGNYALEKKV